MLKKPTCHFLEKSDVINVKRSEAGKGQVKEELKEKTISGTVYDAASGEPFPFVTVSAKGTTVGQVTDANGRYRISVPDATDVLVFSFVGYVTKEETIGTRTVIDVNMQEEVTSLDEVVVTALGVERSQKALGYAVQEVSGEQLTQARETNVVKLAGRSCCWCAGGWWRIWRRFYFADHHSRRKLIDPRSKTLHCLW